METELLDCLNGYASGRRSGDQFCVYVADRLVLPTLDSGQIRCIGQGTLRLDGLVRGYVRDRLSYRFVETPDGVTAAAVERRVRTDGLGAGPPLLNPYTTDRVAPDAEPREVSRKS